MIDNQVICKHYADMNSHELYETLSLRNEVFIVEQNCPYQDIDHIDCNAFHFFIWQEQTLVATARLYELQSGVLKFGRIATKSTVRGKGLGKRLVASIMETIKQNYQQPLIVISAQKYLKRFYSAFGFVQKGETYLEDDIDHIRMETYG